MGRWQVLGSRVLLRRLRQAAYLGAHPFSHLRCASVVRESRLSANRRSPLKYLGDHLALSLRTPERRQALIGHYGTLPKLLHSSIGDRLQSGLLLWTRRFDDGAPPLKIVLEHSRLAPMEGELQLRFGFRSDLYVLTFLLAPGQVFGSDEAQVIFIGGVQGAVAAREEMREASRRNGEISPAAMLVLAIQALAKALGVHEMLAIAEDDHISLGYSASNFTFDYRRFWTEVGGRRVGTHYRIPIETSHKPLSEIALTHRTRTKRKRQAKRLIRDAIERRLREIMIDAPSAVGSVEEPTTKAEPTKRQPAFS